MTTDEPEFSRMLSRLARRIDEQDIALQEVKEGQQRILDRFDQMQTFMVNRIDAVESRLNRRIDRLFMALVGTGAGIVVAQAGVIITLLLR